MDLIDTFCSGIFWCLPVGLNEINHYVLLLFGHDSYFFFAYKLAGIGKSLI